AARALLEEAIGLGDTLVLAQMLEPGVGAKGFDVTPVVRGIFEHAPIVGAVPAAVPRTGGERTQERLAVLRIDVVFDHYQNRTTVRLHGVRRDRRRPMQGGRKIHTCARL